MVLPSSPHYVLRAPQPPPRSSTITAISGDTALVIAALGLAATAGAFQSSLSSGEAGINAFLMKEKRDNPFYKSDFVAEKPRVPRLLAGLRLPKLDFVEVYGQSDAPSSTPSSQRPDVAALYRRLDNAIEREQYDTAAALKAQIDELLAAESSS